ncbi:hypothetical protein SRA_05661 [Streptococcus ratti FA-1 = DSM 20564]|uniref:Uncharacterized protein n=1 Tax=Streptococcus ratti FA-1 = DSM 20564 TaxID=699248 RepID=A0ABP2QY73_STRRT|nr:hypothetical protein SRA_05661 [Streptococcus ratti FA-1 = DSM 20564]
MFLIFKKRGNSLFLFSFKNGTIDRHNYSKERNGQQKSNLAVCAEGT